MGLMLNEKKNCIKNKIRQVDADERPRFNWIHSTHHIKYVSQETGAIDVVRK